MPRCCNENKIVSPVSTNNKVETNGDNILLTSTRAYPISNTNALDIDDDNNHPIVEKSHRRLRCDLSPVPTNSSSRLNIKLLNLKVIYCIKHKHIYFKNLAIVSMLFN